MRDLIRLGEQGPPVPGFERHLVIYFADADTGERVSREEVLEAFKSLTATGLCVKRRQDAPPIGIMWPNLGMITHIAAGYVEITSDGGGPVQIPDRIFHQFYELD